MKEIFIIEESLTNKISYYHLLAFLVMLPFDRFYTELILISLLVHTFINFNREKLLLLKRPLLISVSLYLLTIFCTIYSSEKQQAFKDCEKQLAILLFPLIFSITALDIEKYKFRLLKAFALGCLLTVLYLYADAFRIIQYNKLPLSSIFSVAFTNHNFSAPIGLHANYLSMYIAISVATVLYMLVAAEAIHQRIVCAITATLLLAGMLQLSSRSAIISLLIIINFAMPLLLLKDKKRLNFIFISLLLTCSVIFFVLKSETFEKRFVKDLKNDLASSGGGIVPTESRMARWKCAWELFLQSPLIGFGTGSETDLLKEKYFEKHFYVSYLNELNTHNEYISYLLKAGVPGLILYLYVLIIGLVKALNRRDFLYFSFLLTIVIVSFSENILDTNKGIFYFSFFYSFFYFPDAKVKMPVTTTGKIT